MTKSILPSPEKPIWCSHLSFADCDSITSGTGHGRAYSALSRSCSCCNCLSLWLSSQFCPCLMSFLYVDVSVVSCRYPCPHNYVSVADTRTPMFDLSHDVLRPHRMHEMRTIAIEVPGLSLSHAASCCFPVQTRLKGSRSCFGTSVWRLFVTQRILC